MSRGTDSDLALFLGTSQSEKCSCNQAGSIDLFGLFPRAFVKQGFPVFTKTVQNHQPLERFLQRLHGAFLPFALIISPSEEIHLFLQRQWMEWGLTLQSESVGKCPTK
jgi:hypothetical protein